MPVLPVWRGGQTYSPQLHPEVLAGTPCPMGWQWQRDTSAEIHGLDFEPMVGHSLCKWMNK